MAIEWRPVLIAFVISVLAGAALGFAWGIVGFAAFFAARDFAATFYESPFATIAGFMVGLIPIVVGAIYLTRSVTRHPYEHAAIFGGLNALLAILLIPFFQDELTTILDAVYFVIVVPVALVSCWCTLKLGDPR